MGKNYITSELHMLASSVGGVLLQERNKSSIANVAEKELNLLGRHLDVLKTVKEQGPIGIIRLSQMTGQPQHMIRYSLRTLEKDGIIIPSPQGAIVTAEVHETLGTLESTLDEINTTVMKLKDKLR
jgi:predicted transcriptional regulator